MKPIEVIETLTKTNPTVARFILVGLAVFAAAAIASSFQDVNTAVLTGTYVLIFAVAATILAYALNDGPFSLFIGRALISVMFAVLLIVTYGTVLPRYSPFQSPACILRFWVPCEIAADQSADRTAPSISIKPVVDPVVPQGALDRSKYTIWIQFAGYKREDVAAAAIALKDAGWNVPSAEKGGKRTPLAAGYAEVRYRTPTDKSAADLLAKDLTETGLKQNVTTVEVPDIEPNKLEVWIGLE